MLVACGDDSERSRRSDAPSSSDEVRSNTPQITVDDSARDVSFLLTESDVRGIDRFAGVVAQDVSDVPAFENPDPRGPCGAVVPQLPLEGAVGRAFSGPDVVVFELVVTAGAEQHDFLDAVQADQHVGCEGHESMTNLGETQTVSDTEFIDQRSVGDDGIGWTSRIDIGSRTAYGGAAAFVNGDRMAFIQVSAASPIDATMLEALVDLAVARMSN